MSDAVRKGVRLAGPRTGDDQEGNSDMPIDSDAVLNGSTLLWIERFEIGCCRRRKHELSPLSNFTLGDSPWNRNEIRRSPQALSPAAMTHSRVSSRDLVLRGPGAMTVVARMLPNSLARACLFPLESGMGWCSGAIGVVLPND
jgi:hypothetical protein